MDPAERPPLHELRRVDDEELIGGGDLLEETPVGEIVRLMGCESHSLILGFPLARVQLFSDPYEKMSRVRLTIASEV